MRKITKEATAAFLAGRQFSSGNTSVEYSPLGGVVVLKLFGNAIARYDVGSIATLEITSAGWSSNTTKERLNALAGVSISQRNWIWHLNGAEWSGHWARVNQSDYSI